MNVINSWFAEPWVQRIHTSTDSEILKAKVDDLEPQTVPEEAVALTCGIDCQKYGFWFVVRAWARDMTSWLIHYGQLSTWEDLEMLLFDTVYPGNGKPHRIWRAAIDTGGGGVDEGMTMTEAAYWWIRSNGMGRGCRIWGTKGSSQPLSGKLRVGQTLDKTPSGKVLPGGLQLIMIDTDQMKDAYHYRLGQAISRLPQAGYLHRDVGLDYVSHILAEEKRKDRRGREQWVQIKRDNHLLDCELLAMACAEPEWPGGGVNLIRCNESRLERTEEWQDNVRYYPERKPMQRPVQNLNGRRMNPWKNR
jgi:phage terminase large subunit GpA-like protein